MKNDMSWKEIETTLTQMFEKAVKRGDAEEALKLTDVIASVDTKKKEMARVVKAHQQSSGQWGDH